MSNVPAKPHTRHPVIESLTGSKFKESLSRIAEPSTDIDRLVGRAVIYLLTSPEPLLASCTPQSLHLAVSQSISSAIPIDGRLAHIVRYGHQGRFMIDYKGYIQLGKRNGLTTVFAEHVFSNDEFRLWIDDEGKHLVHRVTDLLDRGHHRGAYSFTKSGTGIVDWEWMSSVEIDKIKLRAASKSGPWLTDPMEMGRKTVIRRHAKRWDQGGYDGEEDATPASTTAFLSEVSANQPVNENSDAPSVPPSNQEPGHGDSSKDDLFPPQEQDRKHETLTAQEELEGFVVNAGFSFDQFRDWAAGAGHIDDAGALGSFMDVKSALARRIMRGKSTMLSELTKAYKE